MLVTKFPFAAHEYYFVSCKAAIMFEFDRGSNSLVQRTLKTVRVILVMTFGLLHSSLLASSCTCIYVAFGLLIISSCFRNSKQVDVLWEVATAEDLGLIMQRE